MKVAFFIFIVLLLMGCQTFDATRQTEKGNARKAIIDLIGTNITTLQEAGKYTWDNSQYIIYEITWLNQTKNAMCTGLIIYLDDCQCARYLKWGSTP